MATPVIVFQQFMFNSFFSPSWRARCKPYRKRAIEGHTERDLKTQRLDILAPNWGVVKHLDVGFIDRVLLMSPSAKVRFAFPFLNLVFQPELRLLRRKTASRILF
jgi:hypothetical protein